MCYGTMYFWHREILVKENIVTRAVQLIYYNLVYDHKTEIRLSNFLKYS